ncbi:MAG TPA: hypothetical protein IAA61_00305 [Candidatus Ornithomonoglobus merdipullorum]|uniref:Uncharacterized protein n=1 Tax=Candidatus Ornithomonoglobus merdipullorum TaxID=2840895 RepID=A0A9D1M998_9FIRM|nr:hypothetical protein [Candidatus Ornithomonoglobus merdipullorum]
MKPSTYFLISAILMLAALGASAPFAAAASAAVSAVMFAGGLITKFV